MSSPSTPERIGRFRVDAVIGAGGMGEVYKAFDPMLRRTVAIKMVRPGADNPQFLERLLHEAQACARLRHPNVVTVHEAGEIDGSIYMAMEYLTGDNLAAVLRRHALPFEDGLRILIQVLDALEHAHREGVIHRDIKPSNIQCEPDGTIKLVDFGLARTTHSEPMTATGVVMGTPDYASPEQLRAEPLDHRTDVFSLGVVAYEVIAGHRPFPRAADLASLLYNIVHEPAPPMNSFWSRAFPELERIVMRALAKSPADRYASAAEMRDALRAFLATSREQIAEKQREANLPYEGRTGENVSPKVTVADAVTYASGTDASRSHQPTPPIVLSPETTPSSRRMPSAWMVAAAAAVVGLLLILFLRQAPSSETDTSATTPSPADTTAAPPDPNTAAAQIAPRQLDAIQETLTQAANAPTPETPVSANLPSGRPANASANPSTANASAANSAGDTNVRSVTPVADAGAKALFGASLGVAPAATRAGLRYRLVRQSADRTVIADVDPASTTFRTGERVRFVFNSNVDGHLYVVQQGSSGNWTVLFPGPEINGGRNAVRRGEEYEVPNGNWFRFDSTPGVEQVFAFLSREPLNQLPGFDKPVTKHETLVASVVDDLKGRLASRDLVFERDEAPPASATGSPVRATYVVNRAELGQAVAATIELNHVQ